MVQKLAIRGVLCEPPTHQDCTVHITCDTVYDDNVGKQYTFVQVEDYSFNWGYYDEGTELCAGATRALPLFPDEADFWLSRLQQVCTAVQTFLH